MKVLSLIVYKICPAVFLSIGASVVFIYFLVALFDTIHLWVRYFNKSIGDTTLNECLTNCVCTLFGLGLYVAAVWLIFDILS